MTTTAERDTAYDEAFALDWLLCKALKISEVAQMSAAEQRLRSFCINRWFAFADEAIKEAVKLTEDGAGEPNISNAVGEIMHGWAPDISPAFVKEIDHVYRLARQAGGNKATGYTTESLVYDTPPVDDEAVSKAKKGVAEFKVSFDLVDQNAVEALQDNNLFWIGEHYDKNVSAAISETASETLIQAGSSRKTAALAMAKAIETKLGSLSVPGGYKGSASSYLEGLVANAMTTARVQGQVRSFEVVGISSYELVTPGDERTCPVCMHMSGKRFSIESAHKQIELEQSINTPDAMKQVHPWLSPKELLAISPAPGPISVADSAALAAAGFSLPPFHFRCRCTIDLTSSGSSFNSLE